MVDKKTSADGGGMELGYDAIISNARVLVIDDSVNNLKLIGNILRKYSCDTLIATTGDSGIRIAESKQPDLILLDIMMPGLDGFETHEILRSNRRTKSIPVIYLSAAGNTENVIRGLELGAVDYIAKPFHHAELVARIKNQLKKKKAAGNLEAFFNSRYHSYITLNSNLEVLDFNTTAAERDLFFSGGLEKGASIFASVSREEQGFLRKRIESAIRMRMVEFERTYVVNEARKWFSYTIETITGSEGAIKGFIINGTEITAKKATEIEDAEFLAKINELHLETMQSIAYASCIQKAIFPKESEFSASFQDSFLLFRSKEKVSGDFFWICDLGKETLLVLGDCTGHGVPGALLTTISIVLLERIVKYQHVHQPDKILAELNNNFTHILKQEDGGVKDGMEVGVCLFNKKTKTIDFAGARRSVILAHGDQVHEIKGDRHDIGGDETKSYTLHHLRPAEGTAVYLCTDGYVDQLGGERSKKFMKKRFNNLLTALNSQKMEHQKKVLEKTLSDWMGREEQTDDILMIGVRM